MHLSVTIDMWSVQATIIVGLVSLGKSGDLFAEAFMVIGEIALCDNAFDLHYKREWLMIATGILIADFVSRKLSRVLTWLSFLR